LEEGRVWERNVDRMIAPVTVLRRHGRQERSSGGSHSGQAALRLRSGAARDASQCLEPHRVRRSALGAKGVRTLVEAWRLHAPEGMELEIIGEGDLRSDLEVDLRPKSASSGGCRATRLYAD